MDYVECFDEMQVCFCVVVHIISFSLFLTGMNVVMPTAMTTMHTDATLSASSAITAQRAKRIIKALIKDNPAMSENCAAIVTAALAESTMETNNDDLVNVSEKEFPCTRVVHYADLYPHAVLTHICYSLLISTGSGSLKAMVTVPIKSKIFPTPLRISAKKVPDAWKG